MATVFLAGQQYNTLQVGTVTVSSENSLFPKANIYDGEPQHEFRFASPAAADETITLDGNRILNGNMDTWSGGLLSNWTTAVTSTGTVVEEAVIVRSGSAVELTNGVGGTSSVYQDIVVRSGEVLYFDAYLRGDATGSAQLLIQNRTTGRYLTSVAAWGTAVAAAASETSAAYVQKTLSFTVEDVGVTFSDLTTLRITLRNVTASSSAYADDVFLWAADIDWVSIHGHNVADIVAIEYRVSTDNFGASDVLEATLSNVKPITGAQTGGANYRYHRIKFSGTNTEPIRIGEVVIGQSKTLTRQMNYGTGVLFVEDAVVSGTPSGSRRVRPIAEFPRRVIRCTFDYFTDAEYTEALRHLWERSRGGANPVVFWPDNTEQATITIVHGRLSQEWGFDWTLPTHRVNNEIVVTESPFAVSL